MKMSSYPHSITTRAVLKMISNKNYRQKSNMQKLPQGRNADIVVQKLGKEILIYDLKTHRAYNLNETAAAVYQACDGKSSFDELKINTKFTDELIFLTLDQLKKERLIEEGEEYVSPFAGMTRREVIRKAGLASMIALPVISSLIAPTAAMAQSSVACVAPGAPAISMGFVSCAAVNISFCNSLCNTTNGASCCSRRAQASSQVSCAPASCTCVCA